jgi:magnesium-transporting ATPase (P-type)
MEGMGMFERTEFRGGRSEIGGRLTLLLALATTIATATAAITTALTTWISTLPAITAVSLSRAFRSWTQIINFNLSIWMWTFSITGVAIAFVFVRQFYMDQILKPESNHRRPLSSDL